MRFSLLDSKGWNTNFFPSEPKDQALQGSSQSKKQWDQLMIIQ